MSNEPLALRIANVIKHSKGTMPIGLIVDSAEEAAKAKGILAHRGQRRKHVTAWAHQNGQDIRA
jgi:hypothetical protein